MLGVITVDDVIDVITEEATEDMYHLAGLSEEDRVEVSRPIGNVPGVLGAAAGAAGEEASELEEDKEAESPRNND